MRKAGLLSPDHVGIKKTPPRERGWGDTVCEGQPSKCQMAMFLICRAATNPKGARNQATKCAGPAILVARCASLIAPRAEIVIRFLETINVVMGMRADQGQRDGRVPFRRAPGVEDRDMQLDFSLFRLGKAKHGHV